MVSSGLFDSRLDTCDELLASFLGNVFDERKYDTGGANVGGLESDHEEVKDWQALQIHLYSGRESPKKYEFRAPARKYKHAGESCWMLRPNARWINLQY